MFEKNICLGGHAVHVQAGTPAAEQMLTFMFDDIPEESFKQVEAAFSLEPGEDETWQVLKGEEQVYQNPELTDAGNFLMGEVVFHLIENNHDFMAIHAALLSDDKGGILMPGSSGNGKSTLSIWMTNNGYHYHTDELVLIELGTLKSRVFTRPFNIKAHGIDAIDKLLGIDTLTPPASRGDFITMIPHRALNPEYVAQAPEITRILFPKYDLDGCNKLAPLSRAAAGIELMKTHVIARNLPGHGFNQLLDIIKSVPAYTLEYNHFDALPELLDDL